MQNRASTRQSLITQLITRSCHESDYSSKGANQRKLQIGLAYCRKRERVRRDISLSYNIRPVGFRCQSTTASGALPATQVRTTRRGAASGLQNLASLGMNLLIFELAGIPAAAEGLYQIDRADHLLTEQLGLQTLAG